MVKDRIRIAAAVVLLSCLALPAYTCAGYVGPDGVKVDSIPQGADSTKYRPAKIAHYPLEGKVPLDPGLWVTLVAFAWPVPFIFYRRRRPAPAGKWMAWIEMLLAVASGVLIYEWSTIGDTAFGTYVAIAADSALVVLALAEAFSSP